MKNIFTISLIIITVGIFGVVLTTNALSKTFSSFDTTIVQQEPKLEEPAPQYPPVKLEPSSITPPTKQTNIQIFNWPKKILEPVHNIQASRAGSCVTPTPGMIITSNTTLCAGVYTNTTPVTTFITIDADNVSLDCQGAELVDDTTNHFENGIVITPESDNVTIQNCTLRNMFVGISAGIFNGAFNPTNNLLATNNTFYNEYAYYTNFLLQYVQNSEISYNTRSDANDDIAITNPAWSSSSFMIGLENSNNDIHHNTIHNNHGIHLSLNSNNNDIHHNTITYMARSSGGVEIDRASHTNIIRDNVISTTQTDMGWGVILHGYGTGDLAGDPSYLVAAHDNIIRNNYFSGTGIVTGGVAILHESTNNIVEDNVFNLGTSFTNILQQFGSTDNGTVTYYFPHHNTLQNNTITCSGTFPGDGISYSNGTTYTLIEGNTIDGCYQGIRAEYYPSSPNPQVPITNTTITNNNIENSISHSIAHLNIGITIDTLISQNYFYHNGNWNGSVWSYGLIINGSQPNTLITENIFIENGLNQSGVYHQIFGSDPAVLLDNNGRGNYYHDYDEPIEGCNDIDQNNICDDPYFPPFSNLVDNFPFTDQIATTTHPPTLDPIAPIIINEMNNAIIIIDANDVDNDTLTYNVDDARFTSMEGCWPGRHAFLWIPDEYSSGSYTINVTVSDGIYEVTQPVSVTVHNTCQKNKWGVMICTSYHQNLACY